MLLCAALVTGTARPVLAQAWQQFATPEEAGFSRNGLEAVRRHADSVQSGALLAVYRGRVLMALGDVQGELELHSVRKSLVSALYGLGVAEQRITLDRTLGELGIVDLRPLTQGEQSAQVRHLISARSGVYLPAAYAGADQDRARPARDAHAPGTFFLYNNWDFNVAGVIYERLMGEDLYEAFARRIARPIGMQDFEPSDGFKVYEPGQSVFPAHTFRMSTRDLARFGQLYLQHGQWNGKQIIPVAWIRESTKPHSDFGDGRGYGYMWWVHAAGSLGERYPHLKQYDAFSASGTGGQAIIVVPGADLVVVHRGDTDHNRNVAGRDIWLMVDGILGAPLGEPRGQPRLVSLTPAPLASQLPAELRRSYLSLNATLLTEYTGEYQLAPQVFVRVHVFQNRLFIVVPNEGEAELLALSATEFTIMPVPGVRVVFERDTTGKVALLQLHRAGQVMRASRR